jgi:hypothetical protein
MVRAIAGIGGGGMNTMSAVITSDLVSLRERGKYQGYANIAYAVKKKKKKKKKGFPSFQSHSHFLLAWVGCRCTFRRHHYRYYWMAILLLYQHPLFIHLPLCLYLHSYQLQPQRTNNAKDAW